MNAVLDASVVIKSLFYEKGTEIVQKLISHIDYMYEPDIFTIEMYAVITKKYRNQEIDIDTVFLKSRELDKINFEIITHEAISKEALDIATQLPVSYYDALYVSTAVLTDSRFFTADERLVRGLSTTRLSGYVKSIYV